MDLHVREVRIMFDLVQKKFKEEIEYETVICYRRALTDAVEIAPNVVDLLEELCNNAWYLKKGVEHVIKALQSFDIEIEGVE